MASEEPFDSFDTSLKKKKKKKTVAFTEDPLGADADPTTPAPPLDDPALGPATVHEQMKQNGRSADAEDGVEDTEVSAGLDDFSDLKKKKKKKKDIPMDLVCSCWFLFGFWVVGCCVLFGLTDCVCCFVWACVDRRRGRVLRRLY